MMRSTMMFINKQKGFTLIEVLLVIAILAILAAVVIVAINPAKQFAEARDSQRRADVNTLLNALHQYALDNGGRFPETIDTVEREICRNDAEMCIHRANLSDLIYQDKYFVSVPQDPRCEVVEEVCAFNGTGYFVVRTENGRITVSAPSAENSVISVSR